MHIAATDDRHLNVRIKQGESVSPEYAKRFAGGSVPDDSIPTVEEVRKYLTERRTAIAEHFQSLREEQLATKPHEQAPWNYQDWMKLLAWHEAHHQGQAHLTLNLYKASKI